MEARSAWCAFEGRDIRRVLPLFLSFVCSFSSILMKSFCLVKYSNANSIQDSPSQ